MPNTITYDDGTVHELSGDVSIRFSDRAQRSAEIVAIVERRENGTTIEVLFDGPTSAAEQRHR